MPTNRGSSLAGVALGLGLSACKPTPRTPPAAAATNAAAAPAASLPAAQATPPTCPDADFPSFLKCFEASVKAQRASVAKVVTMDSMDSDAQPEPRQITKQVPRADLTFPILLDPKHRKAEGLEGTFTEVGPVEGEIKHDVPDSDMQVRFTFEATPCWTLARISDDTI